MMYKVEAIIREEKLEDIKEALHEIDVKNACAARPLAPSAEPALNPNQPNQRIAAPKNTNGMLWTR